ncbi:tyrosine-type recombinase/integrase [Mesorhizobium australicum]|uniref:Tyrosine-type recombinase/integrase n=1 Tax=Mesorhizobium australicum TaxID=536018 RepID=A0ACC6T111_9HYPH
MAEALTQKKIDALQAKRPAAKREIPDGGQAGLYLVVGPRAMKWIVRYRAAAQNVKLAIGDYGKQQPALGLHDARKAAQAKLQAVSEGRDPRTADDAARRRNLTVEDAFADFMERHSRLRNKASTARENQAFIDREIIPKLRGRRIQSVTRHDIIDLVDGIADDKRSAEGKILAKGRPQSAVRVRALLSKSFAWFGAKGMISESPFRNIEVPAPPRARDRVLSDDEVRWLWVATEAVGWPFGDLTRLLLLTAQRRDEVAAAEWRELEFEGDNPQWSIPATRTKNERRQDLPLSSQAAAILAALPRIVVDDKESVYVLSTTGASPVSGYSRAKSKIDKAMLEAARKETGDAALTLQPWTFHDLRRTAASGMAGLGVPVHVVEAILNHKSGVISGVAAIYNRHDYAREKRQALEAWANRVDQIVTGSAGGNVVALRRS